MPYARNAACCTVHPCKWVYHFITVTRPKRVKSKSHIVAAGAFRSVSGAFDGLGHTFLVAIERQPTPAVTMSQGQKAAEDTKGIFKGLSVRRLHQQQHPTSGAGQLTESTGCDRRCA